MQPSKTSLTKCSPNSHRLRLRAGHGSRNMRLDALPTHRAPAYGFTQRAEKHDVHHLAIVKTLDQQRREQRPVFMFLKRKRDHARQQIYEHEYRKKYQRAFHVLRGPKLRQPGEMKL